MTGFLEHEKFSFTPDKSVPESQARENFPVQAAHLSDPSSLLFPQKVLPFRLLQCRQAQLLSEYTYISQWSLVTHYAPILPFLHFVNMALFMPSTSYFSPYSHWFSLGSVLT
jgi:hypothetical protein